MVIVGRHSNSVAPFPKGSESVEVMVLVQGAPSPKVMESSTGIAVFVVVPVGGGNATKYPGRIGVGDIVGGVGGAYSTEDGKTEARLLELPLGAQETIPDDAATSFSHELIGRCSSAPPPAASSSLAQVDRLACLPS
jgi:hypothetical protein